MILEFRYRNNLFKKDLIISLVLFIFIIFIRYYTPDFIGNIIALLLLLVFLYDKKNNGLYLAFFLLLLSTPGMLFNEMGNHSLPSISVPGFERKIFYGEIISFVILFKYLIYGRNIYIFYKKQIIIIITYSFILLLLGFTRGMSILTIFKTIRYIIPLFLFLALPGLLPAKKELLRFINLIFYFSFICILSQLFEITLGHPVSYYLGDIMLNTNMESTEYEASLSRVFYGQFIIIISFSVSLFFALRKDNIFNRNLLFLVAFLDFASVFLSATRGWILAFGFIFIIYYFIAPIKNIKIIFYGLGVLMILFIISPTIEKQMKGALNRFDTTELLLQGDKTAGGTLTRLTNRGPKVMKEVRKSPLFGFGFSDYYYKYADVHVGNQTLLLNGGIIGYI